MSQVEARLNIEVQTELLNVLHVVLLVLACDQFEVIARLRWQSELQEALNLDVGLGLLWTLHCDEAGTALLIIGAFLLDLIAKALFGGKGGHGEFVDLIHLHRLHLIKLKRPLDQLELWLGLEHENCFFVGDAK